MIERTACGTMRCDDCGNEWIGDEQHDCEKEESPA